MIQLLNLAYPEKSQIKYKVIEFSDTQHLLELDPTTFDPESDHVVILSRFTWNDLQLIIQAKKALDKFSFLIKTVDLYIPYFLGARSDRDFTEDHNGIWYIKDVVGPIINSLNFNAVSIVDPHSYAVGNVINNFSHESVLVDLTTIALNEIGPLEEETQLYLIAPDKGGVQRLRYVTKNLKGFKFTELYCDKERDEKTGRLDKVVVPTDDLKGAACVIIDDLCDGGRTFINLGSELNAKGAGLLYLVVPHMIASSGFQELAFMFEKIYTTNSQCELSVKAARAKEYDHFTRTFHVEDIYENSY